MCAQNIERRTVRSAHVSKLAATCGSHMDMESYLTLPGGYSGRLNLNCIQRKQLWILQAHFASPLSSEVANTSMRVPTNCLPVSISLHSFAVMLALSEFVSETLIRQNLRRILMRC